jgi:predicted dienelactone hydrolase
MPIAIEHLLIWVSAAFLIASLFVAPRWRQPLRICGGSLALLVALALVVMEGTGWQLLPLWLGAGSILLGVLLSSMRKGVKLRPARKVWGYLRIVVSAGLVAAAGLTLALFPHFVLPPPTGPHAVGTTTLQWRDADRPEPATPEDDDDRRIVVAQLWYPASGPPAGSPKSLYLGRTLDEADAVGQGLSELLGVPKLFIDEAIRGKTDATVDAPVTPGQDRFPVVLFSPGLEGVRTQNTAWAEDLASRGYVVVALDHPYDSAVVVLDDGTVVRSAIYSTGDRVEDDRLADGWANVRAQDLTFALSQLEKLDHGTIPGQFTHRLDTGRATATGHSLGGAAALQAASQDKRFVAAIDIDGFPRNTAQLGNLPPALALVAGIGTGNEENDREYRTRLTDALKACDSAVLTVPGAGHLSFTDAAAHLPLLPSLFGSLDREEGYRISVTATLAFLETQVRPSPVGDVRAKLATLGDLTGGPNCP